MKFRKNLFKKVSAGFLASALLIQSAAIPAADFSFEDSETGDLESVSDVSSFGIDINLDLPSPGDSFHVALSDKDSNTNHSVDIVTNAEGTMASGVIDNIPVSVEAPHSKDYTLTVTADGYASYTQDVTIKKGLTTKVELNNSKKKNDLLGPNPTALHAVMPIGDIAGNEDGTPDGVVDDKDEQSMMDAIDNNTTDMHYDLNGDQTVNIADLAYVTLNHGKAVTAPTLSIISAENIQPEVSQGTQVVGGEVSDIVQSKGTPVQLAPANAEAEISESNPIEVALNINENAPVEAKQAAGIVIKPPAGSENRITAGTILVQGARLDESGNEITDPNTGEVIIEDFEIPVKDEAVSPIIAPIVADLFASPDSIAKVESDGTVVVNIGTQIAIKKVTIKVTGSSTKLVDIAEVEFVNNMEDRIPEPELNIPEIVKDSIKQTDRGLYPKFEFSWTKQTGVSAYEVNISQGGSQQIIQTNDTKMTVSALNGSDLKQYVPYTFRVRSVNGDWKSPWSTAETIEMDSMGDKPPKTENAKAEAGIESIAVSWKATMHSQYYSVHYREGSTGDYTTVENIASTSYTIINLKPDVEYEIYVLGHNTYGASSEYDLMKATPKASNDVKMPMRKVINRSNGKGQLMTHISKVEYSTEDERCSLVGDINAPVDNSQDTYTAVADWDTGSTYGFFANPIITLDKKYTIDTIRFSASGSQPSSYAAGAIRYKDEKGNWQKIRGSLTKKTDKDNNAFYTLIAESPIESDTFQLCLETWGGRMVTIAEMRFYEYEDLASRINAMYADDMHIKLTDEVTQDTIDNFKAELEEVDDESGELHPEHDNLLLEVEYAEQLLKDKDLDDIVHVDTRVSAKLDNGFDDFAMPLTDLQPIGVAAEADEELVIYLGSATDARGVNTSLKLVATQMHNDSSFNWCKEITSLKVGRNVIKVPKLASYANRENGGSLYVQWIGENNRDYTLRVSGGTKIPVLNVAGITGAERKAAVEKYVEELKAHVGRLNEEHKANHTQSIEYDERNCVANLTEIVMDNMMYSVPASQILKGIGNGGASKLETAIEAMEQQIDLFYQYKGLNKKENYDEKGNLVTTSTNRYPMQRLNIRYHAMFAGAFMYASGKHIGIEYDSVPELASLVPVEADDKGNKTSGQLSGWGIAHEMGHVINNKNYVVAEVTNNFFSLLATQSIDRINFDDVYQVVTRGSIGAVPKGKTLGMYWQLHSYFDDYYDYKMFDNIDDQLANNFYARMDAYSRNPALAPNPNVEEAVEETTGEGETSGSSSIPLVMTKSTSDNLIRLASAAAQKNLIPFFEAWGFTCDTDTQAYVSQFPLEDKKIQYFNNDAREYKLKGGTGMPSGTKITASMTTEHPDNVVSSNEIKFALGNNGGDDMLGYEIIRNDVPVAFVTADKTSYTDVITTGNNMVYEYKIIGYDKLLNTTDAVDIAPVKVKHDGTIGRDNWTIETNMKSKTDKEIKADGDSEYCEDTYISSIPSIIGQGTAESYTGEVPADSEGNKANAEFIIDLGHEEQVTAIKYKGEAAKFAVYVSENNSDWTKAKDIDYKGGEEEKFYFNNPDEPGYMYIYNAAYVKVVYEGTAATVSSVNILGPTSDDVELVPKGIGKLEEDYVYDTSNPETYKIPKDSVIFTGQYKGSPAYNVVKLLEGEKRNEKTIVDGYQIILATPPVNGELGEVSDGTWIYWIEPKDENYSSIPSVISAELYRVDDALTLDGERMVSNTLNVEVPAFSKLPPIKIEAAPLNGSAENLVAFSDGDTAAVENYSAYVPAGSESSNLMAGTEETDDTEGGLPAEDQYDYGFAFHRSEDGRQAEMELKLEDEAINTIAFQTEFNIADPSAKAVFQWSEVVNERALLKEYRYANGKLNIYVVADSDLLDFGNLVVGTLSLEDENEARDILVTVEQGQTVSLHDDFTVLHWAEINGITSLRAGVEIDETVSESSSETTTATVSESSSETTTATVSESSSETTTITEVQPSADPDKSDVKAEKNGSSINFVAGVSSLNYAEAGFIFSSGNKEVKKAVAKAGESNNKVFASIAGSAVKPGDIAKKYEYAFTITDVPADAQIKVTPYVVKTDGKTVLSDSKTFSLSTIQ